MKSDGRIFIETKEKGIFKGIEINDCRKYVQERCCLPGRNCGKRREHRTIEASKKEWAGLDLLNIRSLINKRIIVDANTEPWGKS